MMGLFGKQKIEGKTAREWYDLGIEAKDSEKKVEYFTKALKIDPKDAAAWNNKGLALEHLERHEEAIRCCDKALEINPKDADAWNNKGFVLEHLKRHEEAIRCYDKGLEINPKDAYAWNIKGFALHHLERHEEAIRCHDKALEINPKGADAWNNKGFALYHLERYEEAIRCCDKALEINPKDAVAWNMKGLALDGLKRHEEAIRCYDKGLEINPKDADAWNNKGIALYHLERYEEAIRCYDKALEMEINPKYAYTWNNNKEIAEEKLREQQKKFKPLREESLNAISKAQSTLQNAKKLGINTKNEEEKLNNAKLKLDEKLFSVATKLAKQAEGEALKVKQDYERYKETSEFVSSIKSEISRIKSSGVKIPKSTELIKHAKSELNRHHFGRAKELAEEAKKIASERKSGYNLAFKSISDAERILDETKNKGVVISSDLLAKSKQAFDSGDYEESVRLSEELKSLVNNREIKYREARDWIKSAESAIEKAKEFGCDISEAEELLNRARTGFEEGNYTQAISDASRSEEIAKEIKEKSKPEIEVGLSEKTFQPKVWEEISLNIFNKGNAHAKDIEIGLSDEVKVKGLEIIRSLNAGEKRDLNVSFKPLEVGRVPLEISTDFKDFEGEGYEDKKTVHIDVGEKEKEYKKQKQAEIIVERAIYDPCKHNFIERQLPRMNEWINRYDQGAYWFAISVQNNTDRAIEGWDVDLEFSSALRIKEAKIEGIEREIPHEAHLKSFKISVPKEYGVVIPKGGAQYVYFKLRADKPKTTYEISGVFKSAITDDVPIRAKEFKYVCDTSVSPEAVKAELKKTFSEKDAARLANTFRIVQEIRSSYCNTDTTAKEINKEFDLLKMYLTEKAFLDEIEGIQRKINAELREDERLSEKHVEEVKGFCEKFTEMWIARFLR